MNHLAFDTTTGILGVGLKKNSAYSFHFEESNWQLGELLVPAVESLLHKEALSPSDLSQIICPLGPGSFTGLRIGLATAKGMVSGISKCSLTLVPTLDAHAWEFNWFDGAVVPLIDARKGRLYAAVYLNGNKETDDLDITAEELIKLTANYERTLFVGPAAFLLKTHATETKGRFFLPSHSLPPLRGLLSLGEARLKKQGADSLKAGPRYLRKSEAESQNLLKQTDAKERG